MNVRRTVAALLGALMLALLACRLPGTAPTASPGSAATASPSASDAPATTAAPSATTAPTAEPQEALLLRAPGPRSRVVSPFAVEGSADPTFEQNLVARLLDFEGTVLVQEPITIDAPLGERGPFAGELSFEVGEEQPAALQVYATSARDGGITHLDAEIIILLPAGAAEVTAAEAEAERIQIHAPGTGAVVEGGRVTVRGFGWASFEQTLVAEVYDAGGARVGQAPITVAAPDLGQPGPFEVEVPYSVSGPGPGRIVVLDPSPAFGGPVHLSSVEVQLRP